MQWSSTFFFVFFFHHQWDKMNLAFDCLIVLPLSIQYGSSIASHLIVFAMIFKKSNKEFSHWIDCVVLRNWKNFSLRINVGALFLSPSFIMAQCHYTPLCTRMYFDVFLLFIYDIHFYLSKIQSSPKYCPVRFVHMKNRLQYKTFMLAYSLHIRIFRFQCENGRRFKSKLEFCPMNFHSLHLFLCKCAYLCLHKMDKHENCICHGSIWMECGRLYKREREAKKK